MTDKLWQRTVVAVLICRIYVVLWHVAHIYGSTQLCLQPHTQKFVYIAVEGATTKTRNMLQVARNACT